MAEGGRGSGLRWGLNLGLGVLAPLTAGLLYLYPFIGSPDKVDYTTWAGQRYMLAMLLFVLMIIGAARGLVHLLTAAFSQTRRPRSLPAAVGSIIIVVLALGAIKLDRVNRDRAVDRAMKNAETLVPALDRFRSETGNFPGRLADLIPKFIPDLPASGCGMIDGPKYEAAEGRGAYTMKLTLYDIGMHASVLEYSSAAPCTPSLAQQDCPGERCAYRERWKMVLVE